MPVFRSGGWKPLERSLNAMSASTAQRKNADRKADRRFLWCAFGALQSCSAPQMHFLVRVRRQKSASGLFRWCGNDHQRVAGLAFLAISTGVARRACRTCGTGGACGTRGAHRPG